MTHGVLIMSTSAELLLGHATGARHWDIPKGLADAGETSVAAAVREAHEECGLALDPEDLWTVGTFPYRRDKDLSLYAVLGERVDPARCVCTSMFEDRFGRSRPEMDAFRRGRRALREEHGRGPGDARLVASRPRAPAGACAWS